MPRRACRLRLFTRCLCSQRSTELYAPGLHTHARKALLVSCTVSTAAEPLPGCEEPPWFRKLVDWLKVMTIDPTQAAQGEYIDLDIARSLPSFSKHNQTLPTTTFVHQRPLTGSSFRSHNHQKSKNTIPLHQQQLSTCLSR
jgi:hypothetical protein